MRHSVVVASLLVGSLVFSGFFATQGIVNAAAVESATDVSVQVCPSSGSTLEITSPQSDSVVTNMTVNLSGYLSFVSQIDILIDGNYSQTVAMPRGATEFSTSVTLTQGTHTIQIVGVSSCGSGNVSDEVVVTVETSTEPGDGDETPTVVQPTDPDTNNPGSGDGQGGVVVRPVTGEELLDNPTPLSPIIEPIKNAGLKTFEIINIHSVTKDGAWQGAIRILLVVLGTVLFAFGAMVFTSAAKFLGASGIMRVPLRAEILTRFIGLLLFVAGVSL